MMLIYYTNVFKIILIPYTVVRNIGLSESLKANKMKN